MTSKNREEKNKIVPREMRRQPEVRELFSGRPNSASKKIHELQESRKAVKIFNSDSPLFIGAGRGSSAKPASI
jgi:hypothetical protein